MKITRKMVKTDFKHNWSLYLLVLPVLLFYFFFHYKPLYGALIAFQDYRPARGFGAEWVGFEHFIRFFRSPYFGRLIRNTLTITVTNLIFGFPAPIILALLLNEIRLKKFKTVTQSFMYLPHFISAVVICGMIRQFSLSDGLFNDIIAFFGGERTALLQQPGLYVPIYVGSGIWQTFGWDSIIYVAALAAVDTELYDAASVDGAGRWKQTLHVTIPGIAPTIIIKLILSIGGLLSLDYEKTLLLYNEAIYETSDIISTYVYRYGMQKQEWSYSTAVGLFNSVVGLILINSANKISKKVTETSLW